MPAVAGLGTDTPRNPDIAAAASAPAPLLPQDVTPPQPSGVASACSDVGGGAGLPHPMLPELGPVPFRTRGRLGSASIRRVLAMQPKESAGLKQLKSRKAKLLREYARDSGSFGYTVPLRAACASRRAGRSGGRGGGTNAAPPSTAPARIQASDLWDTELFISPPTSPAVQQQQQEQDQQDPGTPPRADAGCPAEPDPTDPYDTGAIVTIPLLAAGPKAAAAAAYLTSPQAPLRQRTAGGGGRGGATTTTTTSSSCRPAVPHHADAAAPAQRHAGVAPGCPGGGMECRQQQQQPTPPPEPAVPPTSLCPQGREYEIDDADVCDAAEGIVDLHLGAYTGVELSSGSPPDDAWGVDAPHPQGAAAPASPLHRQQRARQQHRAAQLTRACQVNYHLQQKVLSEACGSTAQPLGLGGSTGSAVPGAHAPHAKRLRTPGLLAELTQSIESNMRWVDAPPPESSTTPEHVPWEEHLAQRDTLTRLLVSAFLDKLRQFVPSSSQPLLSSTHYFACLAAGQQKGGSALPCGSSSGTNTAIEAGGGVLTTSDGGGLPHILQKGGGGGGGGGGGVGGAEFVCAPQRATCVGSVYANFFKPAPPPAVLANLQHKLRRHDRGRERAGRDVPDDTRECFTSLIENHSELDQTPPPPLPPPPPPPADPRGTANTTAPPAPLSGLSPPSSRRQSIAVSADEGVRQRRASRQAIQSPQGEGGLPLAPASPPPLQISGAVEVEAEAQAPMAHRQSFVGGGGGGGPRSPRSPALGSRRVSLIGAVFDPPAGGFVGGGGGGAATPAPSRPTSARAAGKPDPPPILDLAEVNGENFARHVLYNLDLGSLAEDLGTATGVETEENAKEKSAVLREALQQMEGVKCYVEEIFSYADPDCGSDWSSISCVDPPFGCDDGFSPYQSPGGSPLHPTQGGGPGGTLALNVPGSPRGGGSAGGRTSMSPRSPSCSSRISDSQQGSPRTPAKSPRSAFSGRGGRFQLVSPSRSMRGGLGDDSDEEGATPEEELIPEWDPAPARGHSFPLKGLGLAAALGDDAMSFADTLSGKRIDSYAEMVSLRGDAVGERALLDAKQMMSRYVDGCEALGKRLQALEDSTRKRLVDMSNTRAEHHAGRFAAWLETLEPRHKAAAQQRNARLLGVTPAAAAGTSPPPPTECRVVFLDAGVWREGYSQGVDRGGNPIVTIGIPGIWKKTTTRTVRSTVIPLPEGLAKAEEAVDAQDVAVMAQVEASVKATQRAASLQSVKARLTDISEKITFVASEVRKAHDNRIRDLNTAQAVLSLQEIALQKGIDAARAEHQRLLISRVELVSIQESLARDIAQLKSKANRLKHKKRYKTYLLEHLRDILPCKEDLMAHLGIGEAGVQKDEGLEALHFQQEKGKALNAEIERLKRVMSDMVDCSDTLEEPLRCRSCQGICRVVQQLWPCGHSFCSGCVASCLQNAGVEVWRCPECQHVTPAEPVTNQCLSHLATRWTVKESGHRNLAVTLSTFLHELDLVRREAAA